MTMNVLGMCWTSAPDSKVWRHFELLRAKRKFLRMSPRKRATKHFQMGDVSITYKFENVWRMHGMIIDFGAIASEAKLFYQTCVLLVLISSLKYLSLWEMHTTSAGPLMKRGGRNGKNMFSSQLLNSRCPNLLTQNREVLSFGRF